MLLRNMYSLPSIAWLQMIVCCLLLEFSNFCAIVSDILKTNVAQYRIVGNTYALYTYLAGNTNIEFLTLFKAYGVQPFVDDYTFVVDNSLPCHERPLFLGNTTFLWQEQCIMGIRYKNERQANYWERLIFGLSMPFFRTNLSFPFLSPSYKNDHIYTYCEYQIELRRKSVK